jgi:hypothetical protein
MPSLLYRLPPEEFLRLSFTAASREPWTTGTIEEIPTKTYTSILFSCGRTQEFWEKRKKRDE